MSIAEMICEGTPLSGVRDAEIEQEIARIETKLKADTNDVSKGAVARIDAEIAALERQKLQFLARPSEVDARLAGEIEIGELLLAGLRAELHRRSSRGENAAKE